MAAAGARAVLAESLGADVSAPVSGSRRPAIRLEQVVAALERTRLPLEGASVKLLVQMTAATAAPAMEVRSIEAWGERRARIRVACADHAECLPFYVSAEWPTAEAAKAALEAGRSDPNKPGQSVTEFMHRSDLGAIGSGAATFSAALGPAAAARHAGGEAAAGALAAKAEIVVHAGAHATLLMDGDRLHIQVPVVCLESGAAGRTIRVAALDHKQTYAAEVVDATLLKANL